MYDVEKMKILWFLIFHLNAEIIYYDIIYKYINNIIFWRHTTAIIRDTLICRATHQHRLRTTALGDKIVSTYQLLPADEHRTDQAQYIIQVMSINLPKSYQLSIGKPAEYYI